MKTKIVDETFDEISGITTVTIQNKYGHFTGMAQCHPDDEYSMFQGERIAATRANIEFCKHRIVQEKAKIKALKELGLNTRIDVYAGKIKEDKKIFKLINRYEKNIENYKDSITILKNSIKIMDEERQKVLQRSKKNK